MSWWRSAFNEVNDWVPELLPTTGEATCSVSWVQKEPILNSTEDSVENFLPTVKIKCSKSATSMCKIKMGCVEKSMQDFRYYGQTKDPNNNLYYHFKDVKNRDLMKLHGCEITVKVKSMWQRHLY